MPGTETKVTPEMVEPIMAKATIYHADLWCEQDCEVCHDSNGQNDWTHIYCLKDSIRFALM